MDSLKDWFEFDGRISRKTFIIRAFISYMFGIVGAIIYGSIKYDIMKINLIFFILLGIFILATVWAFYACVSKRFHDIGKGSLWTTLMFFSAPTLIIWLGFLLYLIFKKGTDGDNEYGPDPLRGEKLQEAQVSDNTAPENESSTIICNDAEKKDISMEDKTIAPASVDVNTDLTDSEQNQDVPTYKTEDETVLQNTYQKPQFTLYDLPKLKKLLDEGIITQEEFDDVKKKVLGQ